MNITKEIAEELGGKIKKILDNTPEIQIYANHNINEYQWRDNRYEEYSDTWKNKSYLTRRDLKNAIKEYLTKITMEEKYGEYYGDDVL